MSDVYDEAVAYLTEHPDEILKAWSYPDPEWHTGHSLFMCCGGEDSIRGAGCLTQIRQTDGRVPAATVDLTEAIAADERIPLDGWDIKVQHLPVFAEWQRRIDKELNRTPPETP
jgi:hypothetical protein